MALIGAYSVIVKTYLWIVCCSRNINCHILFYIQLLLLSLCLTGRGGYAPSCRTVYETVQETSHEEQCATVYREKCQTKQEDKCRCDDLVT